MARDILLFFLEPPKNKLAPEKTKANLAILDARRKNINSKNASSFLKSTGGRVLVMWDLAGAVAGVLLERTKRNWGGRYLSGKIVVSAWLRSSNL